MGSEFPLVDTISSENIENRKKALKADLEKIRNVPQQLANEFSKSKDGKFDPVVDFGGNKNSLEEDFVYFYSTVEGNSKIFVLPKITF